MSTPRFNLWVQVGDARHSQVWEARRPLQLGFRLPWKIEMTEDEIRLVHASGTSFPLAPEIVLSGSEIELREPGNQAVNVSLRIEAARELKAAYAPEVTTEGLKTRFRVFTCQGDWVLDSKPVPAHFVGGSRNRAPVFTLDHKDGHYWLKLKDRGADIRGLEEAERLGGSLEGGKYKLSWQQLEKISVVSDSVQWRFKLVGESETYALQNVDTRVADPETIWFGKSLRWAASTLAFMLLLFWLVPDPAPEEREKEPQFARIVITKKEIFKTAETDRKSDQQQLQASVQASSAPAPLKEQVKERMKELVRKAVAPPARPKVAAPVIAKAAPAKTPSEAEPKKKEPPKVSKALLDAQKLAAAMGGLMPDSTSNALLQKSAKAAGAGDRRTASAILGDSSQKGSGKGKSGDPSAAALFGKQNVQVAMTGDGKGGSGDGNPGSGYGAGTHGAQGIKGTGGSFVQVSISEESPGMSEEGLSKKEVWDVINRHLSEVRYCYERAIIRRPDVEGKLVVAFTVANSGSVKKTAVKSTNVNDPQLDQCITGRLSSWKFPKPRGGIDVSVLYPFIFKRL